MSEARIADAAWLREPPLSKLLAALNRDGEEARVVGGAVRNALIGEPVGEVDLATTALPDEVSRRAAAAGFRVVPTGIEHGTVTVILDGRSYEVTTLRKDIETFGRHAKVAFGRDWKADAERRDFTMNALSAADGTVHDYVGGLADLRARRVRFIGDAGKRIAEDYLRILRFFRFHAAYGQGAPDADGLAACIAGRAGLDQLSRERVRMELLKLLVARHAVPALAVMAEAGLLITVLGGVPDLASFSNMAKVEAAFGLAPDAVRRLGALGVRIAEDAVRLWQRLRLANAEHDRLAYMASAWWRVSPTTTRTRARCSTGSDRSGSSIACCWPGRARRRLRRMPPGIRWRRCRNAGPRRRFRSRPTIFSSAASPRGRRSACPARGGRGVDCGGFPRRSGGYCVDRRHGCENVNL